MSELSKLQRQLPPMVAKLIIHAYEQGYELTFGDAFRSREQAAANASSGAGIANSLHCDRLAVDLNLFRAGEYLTATEAYRPLGEFWESMGGAWGGRFSKPDGNHFSLAYGGRK